MNYEFVEDKRGGQGFIEMIGFKIGSRVNEDKIVQLV
jgi:hypothetical protein